MNTLARDLRLALRQLTKRKAFLFTAVSTLALCIGANIAIFSVVNSVLLRPLPAPDSERIVTMWNAYPQATRAVTIGKNGPPDFFDRRELTDVFDDVGAYDGEVAYNVGGPTEARRIDGVQATPSLFNILGARAMLGRTFTDSEGQPGNEYKVLLSHGLWQDLFGGDPSAVGRDLRLDGTPYTVVGVMSPEFAAFPLRTREPRLWTPLAFSAEQRQRYHLNNRWSMLARLRPGVTAKQAQARVDALNQRNTDRMPELKPLLLDAGFHTPVRVFQEELLRDVRGMLFLLWGGVACVLLIGAVNVTNLVLLRATARGREIATWNALGASRFQIARQITTENLLLAGMGGLLGWLVAWAGLAGLGAIGVETLPRSGQISLDGEAIGFTIALVIGLAAFMSVLPAVRIVRMSPTEVFRAEGRSGTASRGVRWARQSLVVTQIAVALVLLAGAGLLLASFRELLSISPGFDSSRVLTARADLPENDRYRDEAARRMFFDRTLTRLRALPGVESVGFTNAIPFGGEYSRQVIFPDGYVPHPGESVVSPAHSIVTPGYFESMDIPVIEGRGFDETDQAGGRPVIVIDERLAKRYWPNGGAVGQRMWRPSNAEAIRDPGKAPRFEIVGVVGAIQLRGLADPTDQIGSYYYPFAQRMDDDVAFTIRTSAEPTGLAGSVRRAIAEIDPELPIFDVRGMDDRISESLSDRRMPMLLTLAFGVLAVLLAVIGIYGMLASFVQLRSREIGIRMALGSASKAIVWLVVREGVTLIALGLLAGFVGVVALRQAIESQLHDVSPMDPGVLLVAIALMVGAAIVACLIPAYRATRVNPVSALADS